jgi:hypothetical protein
MRRRLLLTVLLVLLVASTSGCFLRALHGGEISTSISNEVDRIFSALDTDATTSVCNTFFGQVQCTYFVNGEQIATTVQLISELGVFGVFLDPVVLELPAGATKITGTFDDGNGHSGALVVYPNLSVVPIDDTHSLTPAAGKQLVVVDLPDGTPTDGVDYRMSLSFERTAPRGTGPTEIKALMTGKLSVNGKTFYTPILPCATSFTTVPALTLPRSTTLVPLTLPSGLAGCSNARFAYFRAESVDPDVAACDLNNDHAVDRRDIALIMAVKNLKAAPGDPRDVDGNGVINANDARQCTLQCTKVGCRI